MNRKSLVERLSYKFPDLEKEDLDYIVTLFFELLKDELIKGNRIEFRDFGVFYTKKNKGVIFKNPKNNQSYYIKEKIRVLFKLGKEFKERLNTPFIASLDLGTQSFRLCLGKFFNKRVYFLIREKENVRLGEGLSINGKISPQAFEKGLKSLKKFKEVLDKYEVKTYKAIGTAIFRKAENKEEFIKKVKKEIGIDIKIISPEKEAEISFKGIKYGLEGLRLNIKNFLTIDVGGGSSEFSYIKNGEKVSVKSLDLGVVTLKDIFNLRYPVNHRAVKSIKEYIKEKLSELPKTELEEIIITGGSASLLGSLDLKLKSYVLERLHGHRVTKERLEALIKKLSSSDLERLKRIKGMEKGREDIALPGLLIYSCILDHFQKDSLVLSEYGILEGALLSLIEEYNY
ncbi:HU family DNA-binding protein [Thermodesulfobacterium hydrogeniphilum]|uniref:Ppx/GppA phosphatase family protein n=1 Tax=Thermodesulfobacterium hydrogeniphilum TaxID=161156 RepID=UPI000570AE5E|nr:HU family DNA-binding protein [Thermodesulfobacterium hydrogeniphilum]